ncbi:MAG TPA: transposase [Candidatus Sulfotelmatobacter sp.]|nr:transposase [Candidatus Sulfotelmatobacter sp.]
MGSPGTRSAVRKNFAAVLKCGTPALGWEVYASDKEEKRCYHRCKSRFCPSCGYRATLHWLEEMKATLPDIPYTSVVFTMPGQLWNIFKRNRHPLHDLPVLGASVIREWVQTRHNANVLIMVVPHTFGGDLKFNTHLHILMSAGGLIESEGRWVPRLPFDKYALMCAWRFAVINHLRRALEAGVLKSDLSIESLRKLLASAYQNRRHPEWIIFIAKIASKSHFLRYAARYVRRPPIATWRIMSVTDGKVNFKAKDKKAKQFVPMRVPLSDFVRLLAPHVQDHYRNAIRYFGLLAPRCKGRSCVALLLDLGQTAMARVRRLPWRDSLIKYFGIDPLLDTRGQVMRWIRTERATQ